jgi:predicted cupin superfamily sugar epimerase
MNQQIENIIRHFKLSMMPVENTYLRQSYRSASTGSDNSPTGTAIIGLYCDEPKSLSCFHRLSFDEVWHFYDGDPFELHLLYENGDSETVVMGRNWRDGQQLQCVVPANVWQGGCIAPGGTYALYGTTMAPGFTPECFEAGIMDELIRMYPHEETVIRKLSVNGEMTKLPKGFEG